MESIFDRLSREISRDERRSMLLKIGESQDLTEEPMRLDDASAKDPVLLDREFAGLSIFAQIFIIILGFLSGRGRNRITEEHLMHKIQKRVDRSAPDLVDFHRGLMGPKMYQHIVKLRSAVEVFRQPLIRTLEGAKPDFYALLGKIEFEDIQTRMEEEPDPERLAAASPDAVPTQIKKEMDSVFEDIMNGISPDRRHRMLAHTTALFQLRNLVRYPYDRILALFPQGEKGVGGSASLRELKNPLLELGDALHAFQAPPSKTLLETMFLFELQDTIAFESDQLEVELTELMNRAFAALDIVRKVNSEVPWMNLLKVISEDIHYTPSPVNGRDDWFRLFKGFWKERLIAKYRNWSDRKRLAELFRGLATLWGLEHIPPITGYRRVDFPENIQPRYEVSFAAVRCLFLEIFQGRLYHALNLIMMDGIFYKNDNRREYEEVYGRLLRTPDKVRSFEMKLKSEGEYGIQCAELRRNMTAGEEVEGRMQEFVVLLDRESQNLMIPLLGDLKAMVRLLKGVLDGNGGTYDTLSNLAKIGGKGHETFLRKLRDVQSIIDRSVKLLSDLMELEEKRSFN